MLQSLKYCAIHIEIGRKREKERKRERGLWVCPQCPAFSLYRGSSHQQDKWYGLATRSLIRGVYHLPLQGGVGEIAVFSNLYP
jgi:hypothetical protein